MHPPLQRQPSIKTCPLAVPAVAAQLRRKAFCSHDHRRGAWLLSELSSDGGKAVAGSSTTILPSLKRFRIVSLISGSALVLGAGVTA